MRGNRDDYKLNIEDLPHLHVLELGCGVGTVGIHLAQCIPNVTVTLTDLEDATEVVEMNILQAKTAPRSDLKFQVLDWQVPSFPATGIVDHVSDLIVVSECFYNIDRAVDLIDKLKRLIELDQHRTPRILVSWKFRHDSEEGFLQLMNEAFQMTYKTAVQIQMFDPDSEEAAWTNIYVFRHRECNRHDNIEPDLWPMKVDHTPLRMLWQDHDIN